ncbi:MAG: FtsX-like permease family protein [Acidimicrobiia bacterium]
MSVVTFLVVVVGAVVLATAAGARRSATALARFNEYSHASDLEVDAGPTTTARQVARFAHSPGVSSVARLHAYAQQVDGHPDLQVAAAVDRRLGSAVDRARVVAGRRQNPRAPFEITISEGFATLARLHVGDRIAASSLSPEQLSEVTNGQDPGPSRGPRVVLHVVGVVRRPLDLGDRAASGGVVILSPAFDREYRHRMGIFTTVLRVRTVRGRPDISRVSAAAKAAFGGSPFFQVTDLALENGGAASAIDVVTLTLWIFAGVTALAGAVAIGVVLTREIAQGSRDHPALLALGAARRTRIAISMLPACFVAVGGGLVVAAVAVAVSPILPIGIARRADPNPGFHVDWAVLGLGVLMLAVFVLGVALLASARATGATSLTRSRNPRRPWISERLARTGLAPSFTNGFRMTFERQPGVRSLPTRSAFVGAIFGVAGVTAVVVMAASLDHLASTPRLYGWTFDFTAPDDTFTPHCGTNTAGADFGLHKVPGVEDVAAVCFSTVHVDGRATTGWGLSSVRGEIGPEIVEGRSPRRSSEVALGRATLAALHKGIGDTVRAKAHKPARRYRIVGRAVFPRVYGQELQPLADGAFFTGDGFRPLAANNENLSRYLVGRFATGADRHVVLARVSKMAAFNPTGADNALFGDKGARVASVPPEIARLRNVGWFAPTLGALLASLALIAVGHALVTAVRRRRHEFATLKTLGFRRRQVRSTIAWHATLISIVGLLVGLPLGVLVGRFAWRLLADTLGVSTVAWFPAVAVVITAVLAIGIVNLIALLPSYAAANTRPAIALQAE